MDLQRQDTLCPAQQTDCGVGVPITWPVDASARPSGNAPVASTLAGVFPLGAS